MTTSTRYTGMSLKLLLVNGLLYRKLQQVIELILNLNKVILLHNIITSEKETHHFTYFKSNVLSN